MPFVAPTPAQFRARYPEFEAVTDARIGAVLDETALDVSESWPEIYRAPAMMALTGHLLAQEGALRKNQTAGASSISQVTSSSVGDVKTTFADTSSSGGADISIYQTTAYGRRFLDLRRLAFGPTWEWS